MKKLSANYDTRARQARICLVTAAFAGFLIFATLSHAADEPDEMTQAYAQRLAVGVCGTCHGPHGNSVQPKFPRLAGQNPNYLSAQLKNFRGQTRGDPDAISYMWGMAGLLSDESITALAQYYAKQSVRAERVSNSAEIARGREIYEHGVDSEGVPACAACHGADGHGIGDFPRLAGQHSQYVLKQLSSFKSNMRNVAVMHGVAQSLRTTQMSAVAAYVESLQ
jgi:cytochrome c553